MEHVDNGSNVAFLDDDAVLLKVDRIDAVDDLSHLRVIQVLQEVIVEYRLTYQFPRTAHKNPRHSLAEFAFQRTREKQKQRKILAAYLRRIMVSSHPAERTANLRRTALSVHAGRVLVRDPTGD